MPLNTILPTQKLVLVAFSSLVDLAPTSADLAFHGAYIDTNGIPVYLNTLNNLFAGQSNAALGAAMLSNLGLEDVFTAAEAEAYLAGATNRVEAIVALAELLSTGDFTGNAGLVAAQNAYNEKVEYAYNWAANDANTTNIDLSDALAPDMTGKIFNLAVDTAAGADVMRLTGDQDVRIDFTANDNQVKGLDLNGNGVINNDGVENNNPTALDNGHDFEIVDAYSRDLLNHYNRAANFLGDIYFDGTGFAGDGVNTNGNIFLGGLGADRASGGIGNDFMVGGGVGEQNSGQDYLFGGRNADFFHVTLSALDRVDGDTLDIDGGETSDDSWPDSNGVPDLSSSQDSDWVLIEASDDDEPVLIDLGSQNTSESGVIRTEFMEDDDGRIDTGDANDGIDISGIENVDASGNLYGFLDDIDVAIGEAGRVVGGENVGIGSSAQLRIIGNDNANILIGGFDNDRIDGEGGNDLLFGGRLDYNNNPNMQAIVNDGMDALYGDAGNDHIVFEADSGLIDGGEDSDTLWVTENSLGTQTAAQMTTDGVLRFELQNGDWDGEDGPDGNNTYAGYGGADVDNTADQTNYKSGGRVSINSMESVIATGLGAIDYLAAGSNNPELVFNNQQNIFAYNGALDLRGSDSANTLYAAAGNDKIEGRWNDDLLSGGDGDDDFLFDLNGEDGVDVIHRQTDANGDNLWDGTFSQDFGVNSTTILGSSSLRVDFGSTNLASADVALTSFTIKIGGTTFAVTDVAALMAANTAAEVAAIVNAAFNAQDAHVTAVVSGNGVIVTDTTGRDISDTVAEGYAVGGVVSNGAFSAAATFNPAGATVTQDRLIYVAYEDRSDNERVDDESVTGSTISLGSDAYAEDLVINFAADGTRIAEDQQYAISFENLTTQDKVTITINGVTYTLQVGVDLDGKSIAAEDGLGDSQFDIQQAFLYRMESFINSFMDDDTAAGKVAAYFDDFNTIYVTQTAYNGEETVFMTTPTVAIQQLSNGEAASYAVTNMAQHEVHLLDFDGRNGNLDAGNVLFIGDTGTSRAILQTAENAGQTVAGSEAMLIDGGSNDLEATVRTNGAVIADNTATNASLSLNFSVHGDDFLLGGSGSDTITGGTGDDRVVGSAGTDALDGGKNFYAVQVLGEAKARVYILNDWEAAAANIKSVVTELAGLTLSSITLIDQSESGNGTVGGRFDDTLIYQQADFTAGVSRFTITLNDYTVDGGVVNLRHGGAGTVAVDADGNGVTESTSTFTNFENVRTVSGINTAVAGNGQGNDTLNVANLSTDTGGILYNLTDGGEAGKVEYSADAHASLTRPDEADFEALVMRVDGVENVISGNGDDLLLIDETEAAKNNSFNAGLGDDRIEYQNALNTISGTLSAEPTVTIKVNTATDTDTVTMTAGRLGTTVATDTLVGVERITLAGNTAESSRENDVIDVTAMTAGAIVDYTNGEIRTAGSVAGTNVQLIIEGIAEMENVWADGDDTVIVGDADIMGTNAREDQNQTPDTPTKDLPFAQFLDFDQLDANNQRVAFANQTTTQIENARNLFEYTFNLSKTGGGNDVDTVDYSQTDDSISVVVRTDATTGNQYVMVDDDGYWDYFDLVDGEQDRVDVLTEVEQIVASTSESVLDFTSMTQDTTIRFQFDETATSSTYDRLTSLIRIGDEHDNQIVGVANFLEYYDLDDNDDVDPFNIAAWTRIEGSDYAEAVFYDGSEDLVNLAGVDHRYTDDQLNLRGGENNVSYFALETSIDATINVIEFDATDALNSGYIHATVDFEDGNSAPLPNAGQHDIWSYTGDNEIAAGSLKLEATQDAEDKVTFSTTSDKVFVLGLSAGVLEVLIGDLDAMRLTGFEFLQDANTDDVYDIRDLSTVKGSLDLTDNVANDHDTIKVYNDARNLNASGANVISLFELNNYVFPASVDGFLFDFDVLDVTGVTASGLILNGDDGTSAGDVDGGGTDEVVVGALAQIASINDIEGIVGTQATVAAGTSFTLDLDAAQLKQGSTTVNIDVADWISFGGLWDENFGDDWGTSTVADVTSNLTINVVDLGAAGADVRGGDGDDTITGGAGADYLAGNGGADTLDGGTATEVRTINILGSLAADAGLADVDVQLGGYALATLVEGTDFASGAGNDAVGTAIANAINADLTAINAGAGWTAGATLASAAYSSSTDVLTLTFSSGINVTQAISVTVTPNGDTSALPLTASAETVANGGDGGVDTFGFEATAAANGVDTINNFVAANGASDDLLDFGQFLGAAAVQDTDNDENAQTEIMYLSGGENVGAFYNGGTLTANRVFLTGDATANGSVEMDDNAKAVILCTADANGVSDTTNQSYNVYFVEDTNTSVSAQTWVVTLVGTINSATELDTADLFAGGNAGDVFV